MLTIIKIGGNVINEESKLKEFLRLFSQYPGQKILVHGGGREATKLCQTLGIETKMIDGRRVTDRETLEVVTMVYAGLINKRIVSMLQDLGCNALGLTGADAHTIPAKRRQPSPIDYGFVGDILEERINTPFIINQLKENITPVFSAICYEPNGTLLNCNADSVAASLAEACARDNTVHLVYCFEKPGVLADVDDESSLIPLITKSNFEYLCSIGTISDGMLPKVSNALKALERGVAQVRICNAFNLLNDTGTIIGAI